MQILIVSCLVNVGNLKMDVTTPKNTRTPGPFNLQTEGGLLPSGPRARAVGDLIRGHMGSLPRSQLHRAVTSSALADVAVLGVEIFTLQARDRPLPRGRFAWLAELGRCGRGAVWLVRLTPRGVRGAPFLGGGGASSAAWGWESSLYKPGAGPRRAAGSPGWPSWTVVGGGRSGWCA